jgi:hypothetical protein
LVLQLEDVVERAVKAVRPNVGSAGCVDQLASNAHRVRRLAHAPFEYIADAQIARCALTSIAFLLQLKLEFRAITKSHGSREIAVVISSTMPSVKYSCSGSPLMF